MQIRKKILIASCNVNNLNLLLKALADLEFRPDMHIDLVLNEIYTPTEREKLINVIIYLLQINYSQHNFIIFISDKSLIKEFKLNKEILHTKRNIKINTLICLINEDIVDTDGKLINSNAYQEIKLIKPNSIETFYNPQSFTLEVIKHGNDTI